MKRIPRLPLPPEDIVFIQLRFVRPTSVVCRGGLDLDDGIAALGGEAFDTGHQQAQQALSEVGATEEFEGVLILGQPAGSDHSTRPPRAGRDSRGWRG